MAGHAPELLPNSTMIYQVGIFFATFFTLKSLVFKPYLQLIEKRRENTQGLKEKAAESQKKALEYQNHYTEKITTERKKIVDWIETEKRNLATQEKEALSTCRNEISNKLEGLRSELQKEEHSIKQSLLNNVSEMAELICKKLLSAPKQPTSKIYSASKERTL